MLEQGNVALIIAVVGSAFTFAYTMRFLKVFFGPLSLPKPEEFKRVGMGLVVPALPLALLAVLFGVFPWEHTAASFFSRLAHAYFGSEPGPLTLWHGWSSALYLSLGL